MHSSTKVIIDFVKRETVFCVSALLSIISAFFVHPSSGYFKYINYQTLITLLIMMVAVQFLSALGVFKKIAFWLLKQVSTTRQIITILIMLCFSLSMFITNDVALLTFVPFTFTVLSFAGKRNLIMPTVILQTVAANLGSMLLPIGNPQNIYLYSISGMSILKFVETMLPFYIVSLILIIICIMAVPSSHIDIPKNAGFSKTDHILKRTFLGVDWFLLLTFVCFFIFIGNMQNIHSVRFVMNNWVSGNEILSSIIASQIISNVPAAIMLSGFTENYKDLLVGVNIGGLGTLIASMASLISYKLYAHTYNESKGKYILWFTAVNLLFLAVLLCTVLFVN